MLKLSAYIIAYNEADRIVDAVNSVLWADEVVVADSASTDGTDRIARELGARVVQIPFEGFGHLRKRIRPSEKSGSRSLHARVGAEYRYR